MQSAALTLYFFLIKTSTTSQFSHHVVIVFVLQSLDPMPMHGPELGVQADDIEAPEIEQEPKQEVLENKNVRFILCVLY